MAVLATAKVSTDFRVTIPKEARDLSEAYPTLHSINREKDDYVARETKA